MPTIDTPSGLAHSGGSQRERVPESEIELVSGFGTAPKSEYALNGGFDEKPDTFHVQFDSRTETATEAVVRAVAFVRNTEPTELTPLASVLDTDAFDTLLAEKTKTRTSQMEITFRYEGLEITATASGDIWLQWE